MCIRDAMYAASLRGNARLQKLSAQCIARCVLGKGLQGNSIGAAGATSAYTRSRVLCGKLRENQIGETETIALARSTTMRTMRLVCADRCWYVWLVCAHTPVTPTCPHIVVTVAAATAVYEGTALEELCGVI
jgi:hypothetical protein